MKKVLLIVSFLFLLLLNMQIKTEDENILSPAKTTSGHWVYVLRKIII